MTLTPEFDPDTVSYTANTTHASDVITAVAVDPSATIEIKKGSTVIQNGSAATWSAGSNTVTVKVSKTGHTARTYTVTVTKS